MAFSLSTARSEASANRWRDAPSVDARARPADAQPYGRLPRKGASLGQRTSRALARFLVTFGVGVAATLAWQSYGDMARGMIATLSPQLAWLVPQEPAGQAETGPIAAAAPAAPASDPQRLAAVSLDLAALRQRVDQLSAQFAFNRQQTAGELANLRSADEDILNKISTPPRHPAAVMARRPVPAKPQPLLQPPAR